MRSRLAFIKVIVIALALMPAFYLPAVWSADDPKTVNTPRIRLDVAGVAHSLEFSPDGKTVAVASPSFGLKFYDPVTGKLSDSLQTGGAGLMSVAYSPNGKTLAYSGVSLWDLADTKREKVRWLQTKDWSATSLSFSSDSKLLAVANERSKVVQIWDVTTGKQVTALPHEKSIHCVAFHPTVGTVATGDFKGVIRLWDISKGKILATLKGQESIVNALVFSPDGKLLASGGSKQIQLWDGQTGIERGALEGHEISVESLAFSRDGKTLVSASWDKSVRLWDVEAGKVKMVLKGHNERVWRVALSPDGKTVVSGGADNMLLFWDVETKK